MTLTEKQGLKSIPFVDRYSGIDQPESFVSRVDLTVSKQ